MNAPERVIHAAAHAAVAPLARLDAVSMLYATTRGQPAWALQDVSLSVGTGEFVCAVGPSGCGKTTVLNLIAGFLKPTRGVVLHQGREVTGPGPERGVVFQEYGLFPWLTVRRNVEFGLVRKGIDAAERKKISQRFLALVGLEAFAERYPFELSGGMRQRVAVVRALINEPALLLMDEPFAAVDALTRRTLQDELLRLWQDRRFACFFITHSIDEAVHLAQRVLVMSPHPGRVRAELEVALPYPRRPDDPAVVSKVAQVASLLGTAEALPA